jgi:flagellar hook-associated protein 1 FlgK
MSLSAILNTASAALSNSDYKIAIANGNVANAGDTSYSRKIADVSPLSPDVLLTSSTVSRVADAYLTRTVSTTGADAGRDQAISDALQSYDAALGSTSEGDDVASRLTALQTALTNLDAQGADASSRTSVVSAASQLATTIRTLSGTIQSLRTQADNGVSDTVAEINTATSQIDSLNRQIVAGQASGADVADLEDQRDAALQTLGGDIGVTYYVTPDNRMQVYTSSGDQLVGTQAMPLAYTPSSALSATTTYPASIGGITLAGKDVTTSLTTGKLAGLVSLRDQILPAEQAKLDALTQGLTRAANAATNAGTAFPPPSSLTGTTAVSATDALSASGTLRVAVTDSTGAVQATQDIDLSGLSTVGDVVSALNAVPGLTAAVDSQRHLSLQTASGSGVSLLDVGASVGSGGQGVSAYFGLNNLFTGSGASDLAINPALAADPTKLPTGQLSAASGLAAGQTGVASADTSAADALAKALSGLQGFPAAGGFSAQTTSLQSYATAFMGRAAQIVSDASDAASSSQATFQAAQTRLDNTTNVNTDEELANLQSLEQQYQANAQMIATVRTLFSTLMTMMTTA